MSLVRGHRQRLRDERAARPRDYRGQREEPGGHGERVQHAEVVAKEADQWRAGQEGRVSDGCHRADAAGGIAGIVSGRELAT